MGRVEIEFVGLPGCGKSTVVKDVVVRFGATYKKVGSDSQVYDKEDFKRYYYLILALLRPQNWGFNIRVWVILRSSLKKTGGIGWIRKYFKLIKYNSKIKKIEKEYGIVIVSEGYIQIFLSIYDYVELDRVAASEFVKIIEENCMFVFQDVDVETASRRIVRRKHAGDDWRLMSDSDRRSVLENRLRNNDYMRHIVNKRQCVCIDGTIDIKNNTDNLMKWIYNDRG